MFADILIELHSMLSHDYYNYDLFKKTLGSTECCCLPRSNTHLVITCIIKWDDVIDIDVCSLIRSLESFMEVEMKAVYYFQSLRQPILSFSNSERELSPFSPYLWHLSRIHVIPMRDRMLLLYWTCLISGGTFLLLNLLKMATLISYWTFFKILFEPEGTTERTWKQLLYSVQNHQHSHLMWAFQEHKSRKLCISAVFWTPVR